MNVGLVHRVHLRPFVRADRVVVDTCAMEVTIWMRISAV